MPARHLVPADAPFAAKLATAALDAVTVALLFAVVPALCAALGATVGVIVAVAVGAGHLAVLPFAVVGAVGGVRLAAALAA